MSQVILLGVDYTGKPAKANAVTLRAPVQAWSAFQVHTALVAGVQDAFGPDVVIMNNSSVDGFVMDGGEWGGSLDDALVTFTMRRGDLDSVVSAIQFWKDNASDGSDFWKKMDALAGEMVVALGGR